MEGVVDFVSLLPEGCISTIILSLKTPRDLCRLSPVSSTFRSLADSNFVWDRFLPSDYQKFLSTTSVSFSSSKHLYFRLCDSILIDGGKKSFSLHKSTAKKCYLLSARDLSITWGNIPMYWCWKSIPQSRFAEVAELRTVCWLEINGKISTRLLSRKTTYAAYLVVKFANRAYGLDKIPAEVTVEFGGNCVSTGTVYLRGKDSQQQPLDGFDVSLNNSMQVLRSSTVVDQGGDGIRVPRDRKDGWMEIELGEFLVEDGDDEEDEVKMSLMEVKGEHLKGGLIVEGIEVRPKVW